LNSLISVIESREAVALRYVLEAIRRGLGSYVSKNRDWPVQMAVQNWR